MKNRFARILPILTGLCLAPLAALAGPAVDVPTWFDNDIWDVRETFTLNLNLVDEGVDLNLDTRFDYGLTCRFNYNDGTRVGSDEVGAIVAGTRYYRIISEDPANPGRSRNDGGTISGDGSVTYEGVTVDLVWDEGSSSIQGRTINRISDLALIEDSFRARGTLQAELPVVGKVDLAEFDLQMTQSLDPAIEFADFPLIQVGETWSIPANISLTGNLKVTWNNDRLDDFGINNIPNLDIPIDDGGTIPTYDFAIRYNEYIPGWNGYERGGYAFTAAEQFDTTPASYSFIYAPDVRDFGLMQVSGVYDDEEQQGLVGFSRSTTLRNDNASVDPELEIEPRFILPGQPFTVRGVGPAGATVFCEFYGQAGDGTNFKTATVGEDGSFEVTFVAPQGGDSTGGSLEVGSFGIDIAVAGGGRRVLSVITTENASRAWVIYD